MFKSKFCMLFYAYSTGSNNYALLFDGFCDFLFSISSIFTFYFNLKLGKTVVYLAGFKFPPLKKGFAKALIETFLFNHRAVV